MGNIKKKGQLFAMGSNIYNQCLHRLREIGGEVGYVRTMMKMELQKKVITMDMRRNKMKAD